MLETLQFWDIRNGFHFQFFFLIQNFTDGATMTATFSGALKPTVRQYNFLWQRFWVSNQVAPFYLSLIRVEVVRASCAHLMKPFIYDLLKKWSVLWLQPLTGATVFLFPSQWNTFFAPHPSRPFLPSPKPIFPPFRWRAADEALSGRYDWALQVFQSVYSLLFFVLFIIN